ncbi:hypothetical protein KR018_003068 [Drosophila ironensis]|nr:hypothetical protein KR018_003068 [Drosophila ironensis]
MSVEQQLQSEDFDFDFDLEKEPRGSKVLEEPACSLLVEAIGGWKSPTASGSRSQAGSRSNSIGKLSRNNSLTTVSSSFPLASRIESHHNWEPVPESEESEQASQPEQKSGKKPEQKSGKIGSERLRNSDKPVPV